MERGIQCNPLDSESNDVFSGLLAQLSPDTPDDAWMKEAWMKDGPGLFTAFRKINNIVESKIDLETHAQGIAQTLANYLNTDVDIELMRTAQIHQAGRAELEEKRQLLVLNSRFRGVPGAATGALARVTGTIKPPRKKLIIWQHGAHYSTLSSVSSPVRLRDPAPVTGAAATSEGKVS